MKNPTVTQIKPRATHNYLVLLANYLQRSTSIQKNPKMIFYQPLPAMNYSQQNIAIQKNLTTIHNNFFSPTNHPQQSQPPTTTNKPSRIITTMQKSYTKTHYHSLPLRKI